MQTAMYRSLDATKIADTLSALKIRIDERFPASSLSRLAGEVLDVARESVTRAARLGRPMLGLRTLVGLLGLAMIAVPAGVVWHLRLSTSFNGWGEFLQAIDAGVHEVILLAAGIFFLVTLEARIKRKVVLRAIHELRSLAHVVDMHQLTKDPERCLGRGPVTAASPDPGLSAFELSRYLTYCSELLAHIGKVAALHVQRFDDPVALEAVDDIEDLTTGLSRKIWQKIGLLRDDGGRSRPAEM